jgi:hypothetical protein
MIFLLLSLFVYDAEIQAFISKSLYNGDLDILLGNRGKWIFSEIEGGIGLDYTSSGLDFGFTDSYIRIGVNRNVGMFDVSLFPILHRPGRCKEGEARYFSIRQPGFGYGMRLRTKIFWFLVDTDFEYVEHFSDPSTRHFLFNSEVQFNPDTLTFGCDFEIERFEMFGQSSVNSIYIKPKVILSRWRNFSLNFGFAFRLSGKVNTALDNIGLTELGVNTGYYGFPSWKVSLGISSTELHRKTRELFPLRILLVDEEGDLASGLLCLADSGSFQIKEGEIKFNLPEGIYPLSVYSKDFLPADTVIVLKSKTELLLELRKKHEFHIVEGTIIDVETGLPLYAKISIENSVNSEAYSDPETGNYRAHLIPGDYVVKVTSKGYFPATSLIEIKSGEARALNFELLPVKKEKE